MDKVQDEPGLSARRDPGLVVEGPSGEVILEESSPARGCGLAVADASVKWFPFLSWWRFARRMGPWRWTSGAEARSDDGWLELPGPGGEPMLQVREWSESECVLLGEVRPAPGAEYDWVRWRLKARPGERFLGFGERFNAVDQAGNRLFVWTEEGPVGLGEFWGRVFAGRPWNPVGSGPTTSYKPMPFFISDRGYGLLLETSARVEYDVAATDPGAVDIRVWDRGFRWALFHGPTPAEVVERFTARAGRSTPPAAWAFAPWNDAIYGSESVREKARLLRREKIPTTAIWTEDWQGGFWLTPFDKKRALYCIFPARLRVDRGLYPDAEEVADDLHEQGFRWLSYFLPYLVRNSREYREARENGYLLRNRRGRVALVFMLWLNYGHIDLTNPEARGWWMERLKENLDVGFDGWMADFGEYVPPGSVTSTGKTGLLHHNEFPLLWQQAHRELLDRERPDGDYVFFCRSAAVGSQRYAPVFWSGDSNTDFCREDGLPSNLPAALSAGLCGLPFWAADIGGYMVVTRGRDRELFWRWTEFAALLPVMRTHHGTRPGRCWQFDSDAGTLEHFKTYCRLHTALFPYIYSLAHEASRNGLPAVRHLVLHYPDDARSWSVEDQFLLGDRLLVAPVVSRGARGRAVYFPPGEWVDYWTGERFAGPLERRVAAPPGTLPLFVRSGTVVPTLDLAVDTLVAVAPGSGLVGLDEALDSMRFTLYGSGRDTITLWDGTRAVMWRDPEADRAALIQATVRGDRVEPAPDELQPRSRAGADRVVVLDPDQAAVTLKERTRLLAGGEYQGPKRSHVTLEWH